MWGGPLRPNVEVLASQKVTKLQVIRSLPRQSTPPRLLLQGPTRATQTRSAFLPWTTLTLQTQ
eukprot:8835439-Pyramimonas_sp.AAC.1